ncbi:MAG TPA: hypothetical protein VN634_21495 [Candidatus Limnocylindrales bacterium]|nr:hypothetical protein [Candidatus Limnocylindrales bacterium]
MIAAAESAGFDVHRIFELGFREKQPMVSEPKRKKSAEVIDDELVAGIVEKRGIDGNVATDGQPVMKKWQSAAGFIVGVCVPGEAQQQRRDECDYAHKSVPADVHGLLRFNAGHTLANACNRKKRGRPGLRGSRKKLRTHFAGRIRSGTGFAEYRTEPAAIGVRLPRRHA